MRFVRDEPSSLTSIRHRVRSSVRPFVTGSSSLCSNCKRIDWATIITKLQTDTSTQDVLIALPPWTAVTTPADRHAPCNICKLFTDLLGRRAKQNKCVIMLMDNAINHNQRLLGSFSTVAINFYSKSQWDVDPGVLVGLLQSREVFEPYEPHTFKEQYAPRILKSESIDFSIPRDWLENCTRCHSETCSPDKWIPLAGFRLLDCRSRRIVTIRGKFSYVALSYVWGSEQEDPLQTSTFPQTIEDAIAVTRLLHFNYLWIDRYCIDQNDPDQKHTQINNMDQIFSGASLVIVAAAGEDPHYGLPGVSTRARRPQRIAEAGSLTLVEMFPDLKKDLVNSKWGGRAWTFQEGYLSKRRLVFTDRQVAYVCGDGFYVESVTSPIKDSTFHFSVAYGPFSLLQMFRRPQTHLQDSCIGEYTRRAMTYPADALNAFLGVLNAWHSDEPAWGRGDRTHLWGVKVSTQDQGFHWFHYKPASRRVGFPSWSWVGWVGQVGYLEPSVLHIKSAAVTGNGDWEGPFKVEQYAYAHASIGKAARVLRVTGIFPHLRMSRPVSKHMSQDAHWIARIPLNRYESITGILFWDLDMSRECELDGCVAMWTSSEQLKKGDVYATPPTYDTGGTFLLLMPKKTSNTFERVGLMRIPLPHEIDQRLERTVEDNWELPLWTERTVVLA